MAKVGNYERVILKTLNRKGSLPKSSVVDGYSNQYKSLSRKGLIRSSNNKVVLTSKGKNKLKEGFQYDKKKFYQ